MPWSHEAVARTCKDCYCLGTITQRHTQPRRHPVEWKNQWRGEQGNVTPGNITPTLKAAFEHQTYIGWDMDFKGFLSKIWQVVQQEHFEELNSRRPGCCFISSLIQKLWDYAWDMWQQRNFILKNNTHEIESCDDLMAKFQTQIIYHHHRGLQRLPETHLYQFDHSSNKILAITPCNRLS